jgi:hypothetical protein
MNRLACLFVLSLAACSNSTTNAPDAPSGVQACEQVGTAICHQVFACYTAAQIADLQYPPTEAACVTEENSGCAQLQPGYCKSHTQTSTANAEACAGDITSQTCAQFTGTPSPTDVCNKSLCSS